MQKMYRYSKQHSEKEKTPSFSSSLLDKIYRSIDEGTETKSDHRDLKFYRETMAKKQSKVNTYRAEEEDDDDDEEMASFRRACLIDKWIEKKVGTTNQRRRDYKNYSEFGRRLDHQTSYNNDQDVLFFSSTSSSSDSSSGGFSSSDTDSIYGARSAVSLPAPKPVRTGVVKARPEKTERKQSTLLYEQREFNIFDDYQKENTPKLQDDVLIKSKSRALRIYSNLKKVKQPISPGGRLASFINNLFTSGNAKKSSKPVQQPHETTTCSSASSFSRSCLSKNSPSTREKLRNGDKRSVRFCPVSVIVDEECRPVGQKCLYGEKEREEARSAATVIPGRVPTAWKIGPVPGKKAEVDKTRRVGEVAKDFLRDYRQNQKKNDIVKRGNDVVVANDDVDDDGAAYDDGASCSSSDLFELDHLAVIGKDRYREELPVYETTRFNKNRVISYGR
ncbi:protein BIG GRAIN 1-like B [Humulus lupulus]|uniref:protein BIG GRAIN 1-like B n=1 Tax=Humulus lupulus TaxID=3486 RepID=UPI002B4155BA|nr:protein BIG GRAIN 1-like B [Humulus lupulus]